MSTPDPPVEPIAAWPTTGDPSIDIPMNSAIQAFNRAALQTATQVGRDDVDASKRANQVLIFLAAVTVLSGLTLIASLFVLKNPNGYVASITSGVTLIASLITGLVSKPLQVIERSNIFRRWSDTIRSVYLTSVASGAAQLPEIVAAGNAATTQFGLLAASYTSVASKDSTDLATVAAPGATSPAADATPSPAPTALTNPGPQTGTDNRAISDLKIIATGPADLDLSCAGAPDGVYFSETTASFSGEPTAAGTFTVTLTASPHSNPAAAVVATFEWTIATADPS